jgi:xylose isomerase
MEPMYHQYDSDAAAVIGFLRHYGLTGDFKVNVEANHATLAGKSFGHELKVCTDAGLLGSIDANRGNPQNGWDTDQFATNLYDAVDALLVVLADGGFRSGGLNFDAKLRRESTDLEDLFIGHIGSIDTFARALLIAHDLLENSPLTGLRRRRYASFDTGRGRDFEAGRLTLGQLRDHAAAIGEPAQRSGQQEFIENLINDRISRQPASRQPASR